MNILVIDDEQMVLEDICDTISKVKPNAKIYQANTYLKALEIAEIINLDIVFSDIEMPGMNGIELAKQLTLIHPYLNIIFVSAYTEYAMDAFNMYASVYLLKPVSEENAAKAFLQLRHPIKEEQTSVVVKTFGNFYVYLDGIPVKFQYNKTKEMFAYLIDRQGARCTNMELMAILWEDDVKISYFKNVRADMLKHLPDNIFIKQRGQIGIIKERISCDYYDYCNGDPEAIKEYQGQYMSQYSWAEETHGKLDRE